MSDIPSPATPQAAASPRRLRLWIPLAIILVEAIALLVVQYADSSEMLPPAEGVPVQVLGRRPGNDPDLPVVRVPRPGLASAPHGRGDRWRPSRSPWRCCWHARVDGVSGDIVPKLRLSLQPTGRRAACPRCRPGSESGSVVDLNDTTPDDYPQFLGPDRLATLAEVEFDRDWSAHPPRLLWRQPIGAGWSSFAVVGHFGVTQEQRGDRGADHLLRHRRRQAQLGPGHAGSLRRHDRRCRSAGHADDRRGPRLRHGRHGRPVLSRRRHGQSALAP